MGQLTPEQIDAIEQGAIGCRQVWILYFPDSETTESSLVLHDGINAIRCIDAGNRESEAYNQTLMKPGDIRTKNYSFVMSNADGLLTIGKLGSIWDQHKMLDPSECRIEHQVYLRANGVEQELSFMRYIGQIVDVKYLSSGKANNNTSAFSIVFTCSNAGIVSIMEKEWNHDDGTETNLNHPVQAEDVV